MPLFARVMFGWMNFLAARRGFEVEDTGDETEAGRARRRTGLRGETYAYWYLRRQGYTIVRRNYRVSGRRGEIDLIGWEGDALCFIEVKTRSTSTGGAPEEGVTLEQQRELAAMAHHYIARRRLENVPVRFDVLALELRPGAAPIARLHKGAFR